MKRGPKSVSDIIISTILLDRKPIHIKEAITQIIIDQNWASHGDEVLELAEKWAPRVLKYLQRETSKLAEMGRVSRVSFNSSSDYLIQGSCFIEDKDPLDLRTSKERRLKADSYDKALSGLTSDQFELLCGKIIGLLGVNDPIVTRRAADEGIDFYGRLSLSSMLFPQDLSPTIQQQLSVWVVGQAKHYRKTISGTAEVRELVGSVELGKTSTYGSKTSPHTELKVRSADPIFTIFITTGQFSSNAWLLLKRSGVIGIDGAMVAAFLADREAGLSGDCFDNDKFLEWLDGD